MEEKHNANDKSSSVRTKRTPYLRPELKFLGDVTELTRGASGSVGDAQGFAQSSSVRFKKEVAYLDDEARENVVRELLSLRLATWEYIDSARAGQRHLGIIIEDSPNAAAVNHSKDSVDLYSYASMAIAAVQVQAQELSSLRQELSALRKEIASLKKG